MKTKFFFSTAILILFASVSSARDSTAVQTDTAASVQFVDFTDANTGAEMVFVKGGTFTMGCTAEQGNDCYPNEKPTRLVTLGDFYISRHEITQKQWTALMGYNPSVWQGDNLPVENVSWDSVKVFIDKLNAMIDTGYWEYRLPTEAEWEYAARGGAGSSGSAFSGGGWYGGNSGGQTNPVGSKEPNVLGIYDMSGNVWEFVGDRYGDYDTSARIDPSGPAWGNYRVMRGGGWSSGAKACRVSRRMSVSPLFSSNDVGFRLAIGARKRVSVSQQVSQLAMIEPTYVKKMIKDELPPRMPAKDSTFKTEMSQGYVHKWEKEISVGIGGFYVGDYGGGIAWSNREELAMPYSGGGMYLFADAAYAEVSAGYSGGGGKWESQDVRNENYLPEMSRSYINVGLLLKYPVGLIWGSVFPLIGIDYEAAVSGKLEYKNGNVYKFDKENWRYNASVLNTLWLKFGCGFNININVIPNAYLRFEALYGFRTENTFEKSDAGLNYAKTRQGHGLTCRVGAGLKLKEWP